MGMTDKDKEILDFLYQLDRESLGEDVCKNNHHFHKGKYDFCPLCGAAWKSEVENGNDD